MEKKTKMMYMLNKLRYEIQYNLPFTKSGEEMCEIIERVIEMLRNSVIVDKNAFDLNYVADYGLSNKNTPLIKKAQLISKKAYFFSESHDIYLTKGVQEAIKEDLLSSIEEEIEDENN